MRQALRRALRPLGFRYAVYANIVMRGGPKPADDADHMLKVYREQGVELHRPYRSERDDWILSMAAAGLGFSFIPEFAVSVPGLVIRPLVEPSVVRTINLVTVRGRPYSPAVGAFLREARSQAWRVNAVAA